MKRNKKNDIRRLLLFYASDIINHPEYNKLKMYHHHEHSIYHHCLSVALLSCRIGQFLHLPLKDLVRGALLHDFFLYNWREPRKDSKLHAFEHPKEAWRNALRYFTPVSPVQKDIILKHMWPLTFIPPFHLESLIVTLSDKIIAIKEFWMETFHTKKNH